MIRKKKVSPETPPAKNHWSRIHWIAYLYLFFLNLLLTVGVFEQLQTPVRRMNTYSGVAMATTTPLWLTSSWRRWESVTSTPRRWWEACRGENPLNPLSWRKTFVGWRLAVSTCRQQADRLSTKADFEMRNLWKCFDRCFVFFVSFLSLNGKYFPTFSSRKVQFFLREKRNKHFLRFNIRWIIYLVFILDSISTVT